MGPSRLESFGRSSAILIIINNVVAYWRCVPARVWEYTIGGYQVMKK